MIKKVVVIGPESTGKSTLCAELARHYQTLWVPEYARAHLLTYGTAYTYDDLLVIAKRQLESEEAYASKLQEGILFVDTDMYVMKIWCEFVYGRCHQWILDQIAVRQYDLYLLPYTDLPWVKDELREYPDLESRQLLYHMYKDLLVHQHTPWQQVQGNYKQRLEMAIEAVERLW